MQKLTMEALAEEVETEARQSAPPPNAPNYAALAQSAEMSGAAHALPPAMAAAAGQSAEMPDREAEAARRGLEREKTAHRLLTPPAGPSQALVPYRSPDETLGLPPQMAAAPTYQLAPGVAERLGPSGPSAALAAESAPALTPQTGAIVPYRGGLDPETERLIRSWLDESAQDQTPDTPADVAFAAEEPIVQPAIAAAEAEARAAPVEQAGPSALAQREAVEADAQAAPERLAAVEAEAQRGPTGAGQPTVASQVDEATAEAAPAQPAPGLGARAGRAAGAAVETVDKYAGPGVSSSVQGPPEFAATVMSTDSLAGGQGSHFSESVAEAGDRLGLATTGVNLVGGAARMIKAGMDLSGGLKARSAATTDAEHREARAQVKTAGAEMGVGTVATTSSAVGLSTAVGKLTQMAEPTVSGLETAGGSLGVVGGTVATVRHSRKAVKAGMRYLATKALKGQVTDPELMAVRKYIMRKTRKGAVLQSVQASGGMVGIAGGAAALSAAAPPVALGLAGAAAAVGIGAAGYVLARKAHKKLTVEPRRARTGQYRDENGAVTTDKRRAMAATLQRKLSDPDPGVRSQAEAMVRGLGVEPGEAEGAAGIDLLMRKMRST